MSILAMTTTAALLFSSDTIACTFTGETLADPVVAVRLKPVPSLKDRPGLYRVMMQVGSRKIRANAQPIATTAEADVMIRAKAGGRAYYTIGLREDGAAAFHVDGDADPLTLVGSCQHHEPWFPGWLHSANED